MFFGHWEFYIIQEKMTTSVSLTMVTWGNSSRSFEAICYGWNGGSLERLQCRFGLGAERAIDNCVAYDQILGTLRDWCERCSQQIAISNRCSACIYVEFE